MARVQPAKSWGELEQQFLEIENQASILFRGVDSTALLRRPRPQSWSAVECLAHLNLSIDPYFPVWAKEFEQVRPMVSSETKTRRLDFWGRVLVWTLEPPPRFRFPTAPNFQPLSADPPEQVLADFLLRQHKILEVLKQANSYPLEQIKITSPFASRVHYSIWSSFCVTASHERRHLWQAERARSV